MQRGTKIGLRTGRIRRQQRTRTCVVRKSTRRMCCLTVVGHVVQHETAEALDGTLGARLDAPRLPDLLPLHDLFVTHNQLICELQQIQHFNDIVNEMNINDNMQR